MTQPSLTLTPLDRAMIDGPRDGKTFEPAKDEKRLNRQAHEACLVRARKIQMTKLEDIAQALNANLQKQWVGAPAPGRGFDPNSWTAESGVIDLIELARAALKAMKNPSEEMIEAGVKLDG